MDGRSERHSIGSSSVEVATASLRRISWGAVLVGTVVVMVVWMTLALLGMGIGLASVDPGATPGRGIAIGAMIWWIITSLIALFIGGWVAGRLAGPQRRLDGALHGMATWGVSALVTVFLLTTTVGVLIGGAFGIVGNVMQASNPAMMRMMNNYTGGDYAGNNRMGGGDRQDMYHSGGDTRNNWDRSPGTGRTSGVSDRDYSSAEPHGSMSTGATGRRNATSPSSMGNSRNESVNPDFAGRMTTGTGTSGMGTSDMEIDQTATQGASSTTAEGNIRQEAHQLVQANRTGSGSATNKTAQIDQSIDQLVMQVRSGSDQIDREAVANVLMTTAGMSPGDARTTVDRWVDRLRNLRSDDVRATGSNVSNRAKVLAQDAANVASKAAIWAFFMLLFGLAAALWGGAAGSPRDIAFISAPAAVPPPPPAIH